MLLPRKVSEDAPFTYLIIGLYPRGPMTVLSREGVHFRCDQLPCTPLLRFRRVRNWTNTVAMGGVNRRRAVRGSPRATRTFEDVQRTPERSSDTRTSTVLLFPFLNDMCDVAHMMRRYIKALFHLLESISTFLLIVIIGAYTGLQSCMTLEIWPSCRPCILIFRRFPPVCSRFVAGRRVCVGYVVSTSGSKNVRAARA